MTNPYKQIRKPIGRPTRVIDKGKEFNKMRDRQEVKQDLKDVDIEHLPTHQQLEFINNHFCNIHCIFAKVKKPEAYYIKRQLYCKKKERNVVKNMVCEDKVLDEI